MKNWLYIALDVVIFLILAVLAIFWVCGVME